MYQFFFKCLKFILCSLFLVCLIVGETLSQGLSKVDSIELQLQDQTGAAKFNSLYNLANEYNSLKEFEKALSNIEQAHEVALQIGDSLKIVKSGRKKGAVLRRLERTHEAIGIFLKYCQSPNVIKMIIKTFLMRLKIF